MLMGRKGWSKARRIAALAALAAACSGPAALGKGAAAIRSQAAHGQGAPLVRITSNRVRGLYPGARRGLILTLHNSDSRQSVVVDRIRVHDVATTKHGCAASRRNLSIRQYEGPAIRIRSGGAHKVRVLLAMPNTVADACQRAVFTLRYTARAVTRKRRR
jgi:hypothetical protein